jgi:dienelactone hydrolase
VIQFFVFVFIGISHVQSVQYESHRNSILAANPDNPGIFPLGKIVDSVLCKNDPSQSYALYIPLKGNVSPLPVLYFFDPHGNGALPLSKYKSLADRYDFILIGSNNSKNGNDWTLTDNIINALLLDSRQRIKIAANRIYTCGFSGGGKVATYTAWKHPEVDRAIACGAGLPEGMVVLANFRSALTLIAGEGDMNLTELVSLDKELDKIPQTHLMITFDGKHEWPPANVMNIAIVGLQLDAMREKIISLNNEFIRSNLEMAKNKTNYYIKENKLVKADEECTLTINMFRGLQGQLTWFSEKKSALANNPAYFRQLKATQDLFKQEQDLKLQYQQHFQQGEVNYWRKTIDVLQAKTKVLNGETAMYQRLLAYLSLAFYSISNQLINADQNDPAGYFVDLYKLADPTNTEAWYFSALLHARNHEVQGVQSDLLKAVKIGFSDKSRLEQQPEFKMIAAQINLPMIESRMK